MTRLLDLGSDTRAGLGSTEDRALGSSTRTSAAAVVFRYSVRSLLSSPDSTTATLRKRVTERLLAAREPFSFIDELLGICASAGGTDRLDTAIDVLAETGDLVLRYAWDCLISDVQKWSPYSGRAYEPNDDYWYVLLRAVARCRAPADDRLRLIVACSGASGRDIVEGVAEALGDMATEGARKKLREMADAHKDPFIRRLASDVLDDME